MSLGENIRRARKEKGWTQRELAERVDADPSYMNRIETGKANPSVAVLQGIANELEVSLDELVRGKGDSPEVHIEDKSLVERVRLIESLEDADRNALVQMIDTMLTKKRMRELLGSGVAASESR